MAFRTLMSHEDFVESRASISIFKIKKAGVLDYPRSSSTFRIDGIKMRLVKDPYELDWYINLEEYGPTCNSSIINLIQTEPHFGKTREWLECTRCKSRAGILYREKDDFECRKCLNLVYSSSKMNYRSILPALMNDLKLKKIRYLSIRHTYKGKQTKRSMQYDKLRAKAMFGMEVYGARYLS
ncbi:MAG: hypothetical protein V4664_00415 [Patescibacteria group bacterium]